MAVPIAIMSLAATAIGAGVSAYGAYQQGQFQSNMYAYQSRVAQINAQIANQQANTEEVAGGVRAQAAGIKGAETIGATKAAIAAGGLDLGSGSAKAVISSEEEVTQQDQRMARYDASQRAFALRTQAMGQTAQAQLDTAAGAGAIAAGDIGAYSSLLGGAGSVSDKWIQYSKPGSGILA